MNRRDKDLPLNPALPKNSVKAATDNKSSVARQLVHNALNKAKPLKAKRSLPAFKYQPYLISYLDVLGMKALVESAGENADGVAEVLTRLCSYSNPEPEDKKLWKTGFVNFSDLVLRSIPILTEANLKYRLGCFFHEAMDLGFIQVNLINRGILVRGALTIGLLCRQKGLLFGQGLIDAHNLEEKQAVYPRIIISEDLMTSVEELPVLRGEGNSFKEEMACLRKLVKRDSDGLWFLDYLAHARDEADDPYEYASLLSAHRELIENQRAEIATLPPGEKLTESRIEKLRWLIKLHNTHLGENDAEIFQRETETPLAPLYVQGIP